LRGGTFFFRQQIISGRFIAPGRGERGARASWDQVEKRGVSFRGGEKGRGKREVTAKGVKNLAGKKGGRRCLPLGKRIKTLTGKKEEECSIPSKEGGGEEVRVLCGPTRGKEGKCLPSHKKKLGRRSGRGEEKNKKKGKNSPRLKRKNNNCLVEEVKKAFGVEFLLREGGSNHSPKGVKRGGEKSRRVIMFLIWFFFFMIEKKHLERDFCLNNPPSRNWTKKQKKRCTFKGASLCELEQCPLWGKRRKKANPKFCRS